MGKVVIHALLALLCCSSFAAAATPQTYIYLNSQPGDYIGGGLHQTFTSSDGSFSVTPYAGSVTVSFNTPDYSHWWYLDFGAPTTAKFVKSQYDQAQRFAFHSPTKPGLANKAWSRRIRRWPRLQHPNRSLSGFGIRPRNRWIGCQAGHRLRATL